MFAGTDTVNITLVDLMPQHGTESQPLRGKNLRCIVNTDMHGQQTRFKNAEERGR